MTFWWRLTRCKDTFRQVLDRIRHREVKGLKVAYWCLSRSFNFVMQSPQWSAAALVQCPSAGFYRLPTFTDFLLKSTSWKMSNQTEGARVRHYCKRWGGGKRNGLQFSWLNSKTHPRANKHISLSLCINATWATSSTGAERKPFSSLCTVFVFKTFKKEKLIWFSKTVTKTQNLKTKPLRSEKLALLFIVKM